MALSWIFFVVLPVYLDNVLPCFSIGFVFKEKRVWKEFNFLASLLCFLALCIFFVGLPAYLSNPLFLEKFCCLDKRVAITLSLSLYVHLCVLGLDP